MPRGELPDRANATARHLSHNAAPICTSCHDRLVIKEAVLARELSAVVGTSHVLHDRDVTQRYRHDPTGRFLAPDAVVVRPGDAEEMAAVVAVCADRGVAIVPQGGNTGLVGGSVPMDSEVVVSATRLTAIEELDTGGGFVTAGAGASLEAVQHAAGAGGWRYAVDIASRGTATIGGTIATNAGGLRTIRFGDTRAQLEGVEFVSGRGELITAMPAALRNNVGYHLPSLLCGSEGTLGVITRARLRLVRDQPVRSTALLRFDNADAAVAASVQARHDLDSVEAIELFCDEGLELVCRAFSLRPPFETTQGWYVLVERADDNDATGALAAFAESLDHLLDVAVAEEPPARERLWRYREMHTEAIATVGTPHKLDVALPLDCLAAFVGSVADVVTATSADAKVWLFGHAGEGSVHVNVTGPDADDYAVDEAVLSLVADMNGSISAEHGIGRAKLHLIDLARTTAELEWLAQLKAALDPRSILNPNVLLPRPQSASSDG